MTVKHSDFGSLARYVNQKGQYSKAGKRLKVGSLKLRTGEFGLSVWGISDLKIDEIKNIGESLLTEGRRSHGYGEFSQTDFLDEKLNIDFTSGKPRHADVVDWPEDEEERTEIANILSLKSKLVLF